MTGEQASRQASYKVIFTRLVTVSVGSIGRACWLRPTSNALPAPLPTVGDCTSKHGYDGRTRLMVPARARHRSTPRRRPTVRHPPCQSPLPGPFPPERNPPPPPPPLALPPLPLPPPPPPPLVPPPLVLPPPPGSTSTGAARQLARWTCRARCWRCQGCEPTCAALGALPPRPPVTPPPTGLQPTRAYPGAALLPSTSPRAEASRRPCPSAPESPFASGRRPCTSSGSSGRAGTTTESQRQALQGQEGARPSKDARTPPSRGGTRSPGAPPGPPLPWATLP